MKYGLILDPSRKAKPAKQLFEWVKKLNPESQLKDVVVMDFPVIAGFEIPLLERNRVLSLALQDEHMSPYFKTDMNLFQLLMMDESIAMNIYRTTDGTLFLFEGLPDVPQPFGAHGHDLR
ncbi:hypothetical protein [Ferroacidibacillus organovorans]|uniref:Uncharacterized protein n=1 Tax=Ferroacidibacillus organovorans TaxID=1765683 RepID=A0A162T4N5_9BACL|nr:hypothetical protein [Ferroacidibacillus organovorans]KYP80461.1 hypothetical protein AYJ22_02100 [Ferroacidibacillus organovorans]OAG94689.1 hypothetical protein AYW79_03865 [Ferroacidibacillus organovorans]OPG16594.1 hypothetical protein B2M26_06960 [Ferroacidibacillus organovorans]